MDPKIHNIYSVHKKIFKNMAIKKKNIKKVSLSNSVVCGKGTDILVQK